MIIKDIFPLFNYDGEPSVPMGIMSQLPSSHLFIHRVPANLSIGVCAPRSELLSATALVFTWLLLTRHFLIPVLIIQWTLYRYMLCLVSVWMKFGSNSIVYVFLSRNLLSLTSAESSARLWNYFSVYTSVGFNAFSGYFMSISIFSGSYFVPVLRIVYMLLNILQDITIKDCSFLSGFAALVV